jgi:CheY-like chemotaxis protein
MNDLRKVMCVEDDADIRLVLDFSLRKIGRYEVLTCSGGHEAIAQAPHFLPDLVLLDVMMPDLSGPDTLIQLRKLKSMAGVPIVFMTAKAMPDSLLGLLDLGATGIIVKPFDAATLPNDIRVYWEHGRGSAHSK